MAFASFRAARLVVPPCRNTAGRAAAQAISLAACYARLSRYGVIRIVVLLPVDKNSRPTLTGLLYSWTARLGRARASAILSDSERCREMSFISEPTPVLVHRVEEVP